MGYSLTIGGVEYASWLTRESLSHLDDLTSNPDTLSFHLNSTNAAGVKVTPPAAGAEVIYTKATGARLFGGVLGEPESAKEGFRTAMYSCSCTDYRVFADRKALNVRYQNKKPGEIVVALFAAYAPEFDTSQVNITGGATVTSIRFKRSDRITGALQRLADQTGFYWDITPGKVVKFEPLGTQAAPFGLTDGCNLYENLTIKISRDALRNRVTVKGAKYAASTSTTDYFSGDAVTTNFRLTKTPYGLDQYQVFSETWGSLNAATWTKTDVTNPSPPAGHIGSDGYIFTTIQQGPGLAESGKLQIVGGDGTWGDSRVVSAVPYARGDNFTRFEFDVYADGGGNMRCGLWDPAATGTLAGEQHGVIFQAGTLIPSEGGVSKTALATVNYTLAHSVRVRIMPKAAGGAVTWVNTDDAHAFQASSWVKLYDSSVGALANLTLVPAFDKDFIGRVGRVKILNRLYQVSVTVGGVDQVVGLMNVDNDGGLDAVIGLEAGQAPALVFYPDRIPASGTRNIVATYYEAIPVLVVDQDATSIATIKAIENPANTATGSDGVYDGYIEDTSIDSLELARRTAAAELATFANPLVTLSFTTYRTGLAAGQTLTVNLTAALSGRTVSGSYLIQSVTTRSMGSDNYAYDVVAGSRLKGLHEYLIDLLMAGKKLAAQEDDNAPIDQSNSQVDSLVFTDSFSITAGPVGPYLYAEDLVCEDDRGLQLETGECLEVESSPATPARYGMSTYA